MKIATFNINNVNRRLPNLLAWLEAEKPDVACLQELKAEDAAFPPRDRKAGYTRYGGAANLERRRHPLPRQGPDTDRAAACRGTPTISRPDISKPR